MEFGPRALGSRSIIGDARSRDDAVGHEPENQVSRILPAVRPVGAARNASTNIFETRPREQSPYMLLVAPVQRAQRIASNGQERTLTGHRQAETGALDDSRRHAR